MKPQMYFQFEIKNAFLVGERYSGETEFFNFLDFSSSAFTTTTTYTTWVSFQLKMDFFNLMTVSKFFVVSSVM
jgi:hypothetical protein